jgi:hypothetical protein
MADKTLKLRRIMQNSLIFWMPQTDTQEVEKHKQMAANT